MASSSSIAVLVSLSITISEKLTRNNHHLFKGFLDGSEKAPEKNLEIEKDSKKLTVLNPDYVVWYVRDQHVLTYLFTSLSREVLADVASNATATTMWAAISWSFASQSRSHILHLRNQLVATRKGDMLIASDFSTMRGYADEMRPLKS
jgi:hypothetical protein